jgi:hypothetical protein
VEHRLFGAASRGRAQYSSTGNGRGWNSEAARPAPGTLLGPEGTGLPDLTRTDTPANRSSTSCRRGSGAESRPYLENCTVDASIFVAKLIRAHGGCLGTRSR